MKPSWKKYNAEYWEGAYLELNPMLGRIRCPMCWAQPIKELLPPVKRHGGAVTVHWFKCTNGHKWVIQRTHD